MRRLRPDSSVRRRKSRHVARGAVAATLASVLAISGASAAFAVQSTVPAAPNPALAAECAVDFAISLDLSNSVTDELAYGFLALELTAGEAAPDETEDIAVARVPFAEALDLAVGGQIQDSLTVAMLLRAHHMAYRGDLPRDLTRLVLGKP